MFNLGGLRIMGKIFDVEYKDVSDFHKKLDKIIASKQVDDMFINSCEKAMDNTLDVAEELTPKKGTGNLKGHWRKNVEKPEKTNKGFSQTATNAARNHLAGMFGMEEEYASWVEVGNERPAPYYEDENGVHWITRPEGVPMLAEAENDTENKLPKIVDDEIRKLLGGLFD